MSWPRRHPAAIGLVTAVAISLGLGACRGDQGSGPMAHPDGSKLVLRIETSGGFVGADTVFTSLPSFSMLGDGRVIVPGAIDAIYPGPAIAPLLLRTLDEEGIQAVLREVTRTGLFTGNRDFNGARNHVMDAGTTVFTLHADGREVRVSVYALGVDDSSGPANGMSADELAAHRALTALAGKLTNLEQWLPASAWSDSRTVPYRATALRLLVRNADTDPPDASGIANQLVPWPGTTASTSIGSVSDAGTPQCRVVTGADAAAWLTALDSANSLTRFVAAGHRYAVIARPLLPDEPLTCPPGS